MAGGGAGSSARAPPKDASAKRAQATVTVGRTVHGYPARRASVKRIGPSRCTFSGMSAPPPLSGFHTQALEAIVETMFLAAYADGEFSDEERAHFKASVESLTDRALGGEVFDKMIARMEGDLEKEGREARLVAVRERLPEMRQRTIALQMAVRITATDGIIRTSERELILEAADALGIEGDAAADLVARASK